MSETDVSAAMMSSRPLPGIALLSADVEPILPYSVSSNPSWAPGEPLVLEQARELALRQFEEWPDGLVGEGEPFGDRRLRQALIPEAKAFRVGVRKPGE